MPFHRYSTSRRAHAGAILLLGALAATLAAADPGAGAPSPVPPPLAAVASEAETIMAAIRLPRIELVDQPIDQVVRRVKEAAIAVDPRARQIPGKLQVEREDPRLLHLTLTLENLSYLEAMRQVAEAAGLDFQLVEGRMLFLQQPAP